MTIKFTEDYKVQCYNAFRYSPFIEKLMESLHVGSSANVRSYMDAAIDDLQEEINQPIGDGEHLIHNARITQLRQMYTAWYELFELIETQDTNYELLRDSSAE